MGEEKKDLDILDYFLIIVRWKKFLIIQSISVFVLAYLMIYLFIPPQYDSTALIIPSQQEQLSGITSLLKNFSNLPIGLGNIGQNNNIDRYKTIIYSRTNLDSVIDKFDLRNDYHLKSMEKTEKQLTNNITAEETKEGAFSITVRASSRKKAMEITNYIVNQLNKTMIDLSVRKSRDNRIFLGDRYNEIKANLKNAEDSLKLFQKRSGMLEAENQTKAIVEEYSKMEADLATKQIGLSVLKKIYGENSPQAKNQAITVEEFKSKLEALQSGKQGSPILLPLSSLPDKVVNYLRYYRDVKIYTSMLEFIIPLFEQAKFDEQKDVPVLQVIDYGVPPEKKSYPPRILFSAIITVIILLFTIFFLIVKDRIQNTTNPKLLELKQELKMTKKKKIASGKEN